MYLNIILLEGQLSLVTNVDGGGALDHPVDFAAQAELFQLEEGALVGVD